MVASQLPVLTQTRTCKTFQCQLLLPVIPPAVVPPEHLESDFSDVFGPLPDQASIVDGVCECLIPKADAIELVYDEPEVIYNRSHSLVGPSNRISQSLNLSKLTITEDETNREDLEFSGNAGDDCLMAETIGLEDFELMKVVGQGATAKVYQVRKRGTGEIYAMKVMRKDRIMEKNYAEYLKEERDILTKIYHPFIIRLRYSFQTKYRLYLVLDFLNGGHLFFQLYHQGLFREDLARIYAAEVVSAVSHLHANGIMHRDLKPENILLGSDGHIILTDFGFAKQFEENTRSNSMCGTLEYMSPEIILGKGHDKAADWWSVGILLFEMLTGKPPFVGNRQKVQQKIVKDKVKLPAFLSSEAHSLLKELLQKEPSKRLGSGQKGSDEIKGHKWFRSINWKKLEAKEIQPSFRPEVAGTHCVANFDKRWTDMSLLASPVSSPRLHGNVFQGFAYVRPASTIL